MWCWIYMHEIIHEILLIVMIIISIAVIEEENLIGAVIEFSLLSLIFVIVLFQLKAPDVALSSIVVGALIIGVFIFTIEEVRQ